MTDDVPRETSVRFFWWRASSLVYRWSLLYIGNVDENCNRTVGIRLPGRSAVRVPQRALETGALR